MSLVRSPSCRVDPLEEYLGFVSKFRGDPPPGYRYSSMEDLVLKTGRSFSSAPLTKDQHRYIREVISRDGGRFPWKECFATAQRIKAFSDVENRLEYYEGWAMGGVIPCLHGWLILDGERVIDLTWRKTGLARVRVKLEHTRVFGSFPDGWGYRGLRVASREEICERVARRREWGSFIDDWQEGYPLLKASGA